MSPPRRGPGHALPYRLLAGVVPTRHGWLTASAKLQGIHLSPEEPRLEATVLDVLDARPSYDAIAVDCPIGLPLDASSRPRRCDVDARELLGPASADLVLDPPTRSALDAATFAEASKTSGGLAVGAWQRIGYVRELAKEMAPYRQRVVHEVKAELTYFQLNGEARFEHPKRTERGRAERRALLTGKVEGVDRVIDAVVPGVRPWHLLDAAAALWTARRIFARSASHVPDFPEWDDDGVRMEIVR